MTNTEMTQMLLRYAKADMSKARKGSGIYISQTKHGLIDLSYDRETKIYTAFNQTGTFQKTGTAKEMEVAIADCYQVIYA